MLMIMVSDNDDNNVDGTITCQDGQKHPTAGSSHPLQHHLYIPPTPDGIGMDDLVVDGGKLILVDDNYIVVSFMLQGAINGRAL